MHDANLLGGAEKVVEYLKAGGRGLLKPFEDYALHVESGYDVELGTYKCADYCLRDKNGLLATWDLKVS